jgi:histidine decarboxylase
MSKNIEEMQEKYDEARACILESNETLHDYEKAELLDYLEEIEDEIDRLEKLRARFGRVLDYNGLKKNGFSREEICAFEREDSEYIAKVDRYYSNNLYKRKYMFGYPANMEDYSYTTSYLRHLESKMYLMNNCGDPYQKGNYGMDSKSTEKKIISLVAENFGIEQGEYWGYITSGGTESNFWGIREGFNRFPKGKLYFSEDTHYSVEKYVFDGENSERYPYEKIAVDKFGRISAEKLFEVVEKDRESGVNGAIVVLTWGTTCRGAVDEVKKITDGLRERGIEYYCHLDAAHFGGIAKNQENAPSVENVCELGVDSIAVSMHKFMGTARVNGVLLALTRRDRPVIDYIGQEDSTLLGSRDYLPFSTYQRAKEMLLRRESGHYSANVNYFELGLKKRGLEFERFENSNTFVIPKPSEEICKKYQLATFVDYDGQEKAHIIIFPFHKQGIMDELLEDLK